MDRCECYRTAGTNAGERAAWTGADCSQRVCPYGKAHDAISTAKQQAITSVGMIAATRSAGDTAANNFKVFLTNGLHVPFDMNVDVEVMTFTDQSSGSGDGLFRFKRDTDADWSTPINFDSRASQTYTMNSEASAYELSTKIKGVSRKTGIFVYFDNTGLTATNSFKAGDKFWFNVTYNEGVTWTSADDNTAHPVTECSGRGTCDRSSGFCECSAGFGGAACERTVCPEDCSGHGVCLSLKRIAGDAGSGGARASDGTTHISYANAFDAEKQFACVCDQGFRGVACGLIECPSGADPMGGYGGSNGRDCSGRGKCDYSTGICECSVGFFGERCESRTTFV